MRRGGVNGKGRAKPSRCNLSTDGTKMGANASRHKAMSYGYTNKDIARLEAEIDRLLEQAASLPADIWGTGHGNS